MAILCLCGISTLKYLFTNIIEFPYWLRGSTGTEIVVIVDGEDLKKETLSKHDVHFVAKNRHITLAFTNDWEMDDREDRNVFFKSDMQTDIQGPVGNSQDNVDGWNCGSNEENVRCNMVRNGKFQWSGTYLISFGSFNFSHSSI